MIEQLKLWLIRKHLSYCRAEVSRLEEWLRNRELRNVKAFEMEGFFEIPSLEEKMKK